MSYEGRTELLCPNGHYYIQDCYYDCPVFCGVCGEKYSYRHEVDDTNGEVEDCPSTCLGLKDEYGGYEKTVVIPLYKPVGSMWQQIKEGEK